MIENKSWLGTAVMAVLFGVPNFSYAQNEGDVICQVNPPAMTTCAAQAGSGPLPTITCEDYPCVLGFCGAPFGVSSVTAKWNTPVPVAQSSPADGTTAGGVAVVQRFVCYKLNWCNGPCIPDHKQPIRDASLRTFSIPTIHRT